jgi:predicted component of type VI protein secretion system
MPAQLVSLTEGPTILLDRPIILIGRHPECDIQIDSRKVSRRHCCIAQVNDYLVVRDLDSTNGIRINGIPVLEGRLAPGDELAIGSHRYRVVWDDAPVSPSPQTQAKQSLVAALDDDMDSWDEPVALPEPEGPPQSPANKPSGPPPIRND